MKHGFLTRAYLKESLYAPAAAKGLEGKDGREGRLSRPFPSAEDGDSP